MATAATLNPAPVNTASCHQTRKTQNNHLAFYAGTAIGTALMLGPRNPASDLFLIGGAIAATRAMTQNPDTFKTAVAIGTAVAVAPIVVPAVASVAAATTIVAAPVVITAAVIAKAAVAPILLAGVVFKAAACVAFPPLLPIMILASLKK